MYIQEEVHFSSVWLIDPSQMIMCVCNQHSDPRTHLLPSPICRASYSQPHRAAWPALELCPWLMPLTREETASRS